MNRIVGIRAGNNLLGITEYREVGVMGSEYELRLGLNIADELDHILVNSLVIQVIFRLVDDKNIVFLLAQDEQDQR